MFSSLRSYSQNYEVINGEEKYGIKLPADITGYYDKKWNDIKKEITGIEKRKIANIDDVKNFYNEHKNEEFIDSKGKKATIEKLFSNIVFYQANYGKAEKFGIRLPVNPKATYALESWSEFKSRIIE